jgi:hypothetical protein
MSFSVQTQRKVNFLIFELVGGGGLCRTGSYSSMSYVSYQSDTGFGHKERLSSALRLSGFCLSVLLESTFQFYSSYFQSLVYTLF